MRVVVVVSLISLATGALFAQDAAQPTVDLATPSPTVSATPDVPELSTLDEVYKQSSLGKAADDARVRLELRRLQNDLAHDPAVVGAKKTADAATSDFDKRQRLRDYYRVLYGKMRARAGSEETRRAIDTALADHLRPVSQPHVRPMPDDPMPTATPKHTPAPEKKKKKHGGKFSGG